MKNVVGILGIFFWLLPARKMNKFLNLQERTYLILALKRLHPSVKVGSKPN